MTHALTPIALSDLEKKIAGFFLLALALAFANETFDWRLVGNYDWEAIVALTLVGLTGAAYALRARRR